MNGFTVPTIKTRAEWGAANPVKQTIDHRKPERIVLHHSWKPTAAQWRGGETILGIQRYHMGSPNNWDDIGYHFIVGPDGTIWRGRPIGVLGAHCGGRLPAGVDRVFGNPGSIGILAVGNYDVEDPSQVITNALSVFIVSLQEEYGISPDKLFGHCEAWSRPPKTCPGKRLYVAMLGEKRWNAIPWK